MSREKPAQRKDAGRALAADRQRDHGYLEAFGLGVNARVARTGETHVMTAAAHARGFGEDADLLAAPAVRGFRVEYSQPLVSPHASAVAAANWMRCSLAYRP